MNYADFALEELGDQPTLREDVEEIRRAASQAADLTRQLLVFSRREVVRPQALDLNQVVTGVEKLLRRTLGNHIDLHTRFEPRLHTVLADPGEIEQVLVNLAVNARDAMPDGGVLRIRTANVELDEEYARSHPQTTLGPHVELAVEDTGTGMTPETLARAFEPFFTTKETGSGTGLGLATVYGIVEQAGGSITLYSELGTGTVVKVYLPATEERPTAPRPQPTAPPRGQGETILVVEDEDAVRRVAVRILSNGGYSVIEAASGAKALGICGDPDRSFDLVLTDVIMPEMLGTEFAEQAKTIRPDLKVLYMSGYIEPAAHSTEVREDLVEKPFNARVLLERVRRALDE